MSTQVPNVKRGSESIFYAAPFSRIAAAPGFAEIDSDPFYSRMRPAVSFRVIRLAFLK